MAPKKILLVITKSNWGGAQTYVYTLATELLGRGFEVVVACGGSGAPGAPTGALVERLTLAGVRVVYIGSFARDISLFQEIKAFFELIRIVGIESPDILHLNSSKAGGLGALAGRLNRVPRIIYTAHGWAHREPRPFLKRFLIRASSWLTILLCHRIIVVSQHDLTDAPVLYSRKKIWAVPNGIEAFPLESRGVARGEIMENTPGLSISDYWLFMIAELHTNKGIDIAITALHYLLSTYPNLHLVVVGEGEERKALETLSRELAVESNVHLIGTMPNARNYLLGADLFLIPSRKEGLPYVLLESGIAGLPTIATTVGGIPEVVIDHETGLLIPPNDPKALAVAIEALAQEPVLAERIGNGLHERVIRSYTKEKMLLETLEVYTS